MSLLTGLVQNTKELIPVALITSNSSRPIIVTTCSIRQFNFPTNLHTDGSQKSTTRVTTAKRKKKTVGAKKVEDGEFGIVRRFGYIMQLSDESRGGRETGSSKKRMFRSGFLLPRTQHDLRLDGSEAGRQGRVGDVLLRRGVSGYR